MEAAIVQLTPPELSGFMRVLDLIQDLGKDPIPPPAQKALQIICDAIGADLRFCKLEWCRKPFFPKKPDHQYHDDKCKYEDWNKNKR